MDTETTSSALQILWSGDGFVEDMAPKVRDDV